MADAYTPPQPTAAELADAQAKAAAAAATNAAWRNNTLPVLPQYAPGGGAQYTAAEIADDKAEQEKHMLAFHPAEFFGTNMQSLQGMTLSAIASKYGTQTADYVQDYARSHPSQAYQDITAQYSARQSSGLTLTGAGTSYIQGTIKPYDPSGDVGISGRAAKQYGSDFFSSTPVLEPIKQSKSADTGFTVYKGSDLYGENPFDTNTAAGISWLVTKSGGSVGRQVSDKAYSEMSAAKSAGYNVPVFMPNITLDTGRSVVAPEDITKAGWMPSGYFGDTKGRTFDVAYGERTQQEIENSKMMYDKTGGAFSLFQIPTTGYGEGFVRRYGMTTAGGGTGALQSGMFSVDKALTPDVRTQWAPGNYAKSADVVAAQAIRSNPSAYSRMGAEEYGGTVQLMEESGTIDGKLIAGTPMGRYEPSTGNLANLVNPFGVNLPKSEFSQEKIPMTIDFGKAADISSVSKEGVITPASFSDYAKVGISHTSPYETAADISLQTAKTMAAQPQPMKLGDTGLFVTSISKGTPSTLVPPSRVTTDAFSGAVVPKGVGQAGESVYAARDAIEKGEGGSGSWYDPIRAARASVPVNPVFDALAGTSYIAGKVAPAAIPILGPIILGSNVSKEVEMYKNKDTYSGAVTWAQEHDTGFFSPERTIIGEKGTDKLLSVSVGGYGFTNVKLPETQPGQQLAVAHTHPEPLPFLNAIPGAYVPTASVADLSTFPYERKGNVVEDSVITKNAVLTYAIPSERGSGQQQAALAQYKADSSGLPQGLFSMNVKNQETMFKSAGVDYNIASTYKPVVGSSIERQSPQAPDLVGSATGWLGGVARTISPTIEESKVKAWAIDAKSHPLESAIGSEVAGVKEAAGTVYGVGAMTVNQPVEFFTGGNISLLPKNTEIIKGTEPRYETTISKSFSGGSEAQDKMASWLEENKGKVDTTNPTEVSRYNAISMAYNFLESRNPVIETTTTTKTPIPGTGTPDKVYEYGGWSRFVEGSGRAAQAITGISESKLDAYGTSIKSEQGLKGDVDRVLYGGARFLLTEPANIAPAAIQGTAMVAGGELLGGAIGGIAAGSSRVAPVAAWLMSPTGQTVAKAAAGTYMGVGYIAGVTERGKATKEETEINIGKSIVPLAAMWGGGGGADWIGETRSISVTGRGQAYLKGVEIQGQSFLLGRTAEGRFTVGAGSPQSFSAFTFGGQRPASGGATSGAARGYAGEPAGFLGAKPFTPKPWAMGEDAAFSFGGIRRSQGRYTGTQPYTSRASGASPQRGVSSEPAATPYGRSIVDIGSGRSTGYGGGGGETFGGSSRGGGGVSTKSRAAVFQPSITKTLELPAGRTTTTGVTAVRRAALDVSTRTAPKTYQRSRSITTPPSTAKVLAKADAVASAGTLSTEAVVSKAAPYDKTLYDAKDFVGGTVSTEVASGALARSQARPEGLVAPHGYGLPGARGFAEERGLAQYEAETGKLSKASEEARDLSRMKEATDLSRYSDFSATKPVVTSQVPKAIISPSVRSQPSSYVITRGISDTSISTFAKGKSITESVSTPKSSTYYDTFQEIAPYSAAKTEESVIRGGGGGGTSIKFPDVPVPVIPGGGGFNWPGSGGSSPSAGSRSRFAFRETIGIRSSLEDMFAGVGSPSRKPRGRKQRSPQRQTRKTRR